MKNSRKCTRNLRFARSLVAFAAMGVTATACEMTAAEKLALEDAFDVTAAPSPVPFPDVPPACFGERFTQPEAEVTRKVDILFVTDTSGSLQDEKAAIADGLGAFVTAMPSDVDYQVAVLPAHGSRSTWMGKLFKSGAHGPVLASSRQTAAQIRTELKWLFLNSPADSYSDGGEEGMYATLRVLDDARLATARGQGFFRSDAALAVVYIADENDICATFPAGVTPVPDPENSEAPAKIRDCGGVTPAAVLAKLRAIQGDRPLAVAGVVYNNAANVPRVGENEYGYGYMDLITQAHGVSVDIGSRHYDTGLAEIGSLVTTRLTLVTEFTLARPRVDASSIGVRVDGAPVTHAFNASINEVHVDQALAGVSRSTVDINYCLQPEPTPSVTPSPTPTPTPTSCVPGTPGCGLGS